MKDKQATKSKGVKAANNSKHLAVKFSASLPYEMYQWLVKSAALVQKRKIGEGKISRELQRQLRPSFDARHSDKKRSA